MSSLVAVADIHNLSSHSGKEWQEEAVKEAWEGGNAQQRQCPIQTEMAKQLEQMALDVQSVKANFRCGTLGTLQVLLEINPKILIALSVDLELSAVVKALLPGAWLLLSKQPARSTT